MGIWAVVPVKELDRAKERLAPVLPPERRRALMLAMLEDVLTALAPTTGPPRPAGVAGDAAGAGADAGDARGCVDGARRDDGSLRAGGRDGRRGGAAAGGALRRPHYRNR